MVRLLLLAAFALPFAACNQSPQIDETNASVEEVAAKVREASGSGESVRPGQWQSRVTIDEFEIPGMPAEAVKQMKASFAKQQNSFTTCLTPEDVKQPKGGFFNAKDECRYDHFKMGGGKIDATMRCPAGDGSSQLMTMAGTYEPERYAMQMTMRNEGGDGPAGRMTMKMRVESTRIGKCQKSTTQAAG